MRPELWSFFGINELPAPTIIEFFPTHEEFGVRTTGLPWIGTVGASTGNVIALDVPRAGGKSQAGPFDWARVLRHEYTHTITLAMTNNRIPHWLTEACAVAQEEAPRDWTNCQLLCSNYRAGTLFKIADLNWGFIKPKRSIDRQLAYMQSEWIYDYLLAAYGLPKMREFLLAFHDGLTEPAAWKKVYGKTMEEMDGEFHVWAASSLKSGGCPMMPLPKSADIDAALLKNPNDVDALYTRAWLKVSCRRQRPPQTGFARAPGKTWKRCCRLPPRTSRHASFWAASSTAWAKKTRPRKCWKRVVKEDPKLPGGPAHAGLACHVAK